MERPLIATTFLIAVAALVVALAGRNTPAPQRDTAALERRIVELELELSGLRQRLNTTLAGHQAGSSTTGRALHAREPAEWPVVARKLAIDIKLDARQADIVDKTLEDCSGKLGAAAEHEDALWRDRLSKRARKAAHQAVVAALSEKQRKKFDAWLKRPDYSHLACWFLPERKCGGCGRKKQAPKKSTEESAKTGEKK